MAKGSQKEGYSDHTSSRIELKFGGKKHLGGFDVVF